MIAVQKNASHSQRTSHEMFTARVRPLDRAQTWAQSLTEIFEARPAANDEQRLYADDLGDSYLTNLHGSIRTRHYPGLSMSRVVATAHSIRLRTRQQQDCSSRALCIIQLRGTTTFVNGRSAINVPCGQIALVPIGSTLKIVNQSDFEFLVADWKNTRFGARIAERYPEGRVLNGNMPMQRLIAQFIELLALNADLNDESEFTAMAIETAGMFLEVGLSTASRQAKECESNAAMSRDSIRHFIDYNLHNPRLSAETIATTLGCSKRSLYRAFNNGCFDESISRYIWRRRVERCAEVLRTGIHAATLTQLANSQGFSSAAHFSRIFKQYMGIGPLAFSRQSESRSTGMMALPT